MLIELSDDINQKLHILSIFNKGYWSTHAELDMEASNEPIYCWVFLCSWAFHCILPN